MDAGDKFGRVILKVARVRAGAPQQAIASPRAYKLVDTRRGHPAPIWGYSPRVGGAQRDHGSDPEHLHWPVIPPVDHSAHLGPNCGILLCPRGDRLWSLPADPVLASETAERRHLRSKDCLVARREPERSVQSPLRATRPLFAMCLLRKYLPDGILP